MVVKIFLKRVEKAVVEYKDNQIVSVAGPDKMIIENALSKTYETLGGGADGRVNTLDIVTIDKHTDDGIEAILLDIIQMKMGYTLQWQN